MTLVLQLDSQIHNNIPSFIKKIGYESVNNMNDDGFDKMFEKLNNGMATSKPNEIIYFLCNIVNSIIFFVDDKKQICDLNTIVDRLKIIKDIVKNIYTKYKNYMSDNNYYFHKFIHDMIAVPMEIECGRSDFKNLNHVSLFTLLEHLHNGDLEMIKNITICSTKNDDNGFIEGTENFNNMFDIFMHYIFPHLSRYQVLESLIISNSIYTDKIINNVKLHVTSDEYVEICQKCCEKVEYVCYDISRYVNEFNINFTVDQILLLMSMKFHITIDCKKFSQDELFNILSSPSIIFVNYCHEEFIINLDNLLDDTVIKIFSKIKCTNMPIVKLFLSRNLKVDLDIATKIVPDEFQDISILDSIKIVNDNDKQALLEHLLLNIKTVDIKELIKKKIVKLDDRTINIICKNQNTNIQLIKWMIQNYKVKFTDEAILNYAIKFSNIQDKLKLLIDNKSVNK